jgi:hypothetical protein
MIDKMIVKLESERAQVQRLIKDEVEALMRLGAEITQMTYDCKRTNVRRVCITPKNIREAFVQDKSLFNIKCVHWIFYELPLGTHQDVLPQRKSHMDLVVEKVEHAMNIRWAPKKEGEKKRHRNCIQHIYSKILNEKKQTIIKEDGGTSQNRKPMVKHPKTVAAAKGAPNYRRGKAMYYWQSESEGMNLVSCRAWFYDIYLSYTPLIL